MASARCDRLKPTISSSAQVRWAWRSPTRSSITRTCHVTLVDRRHAAGGHWLDAYPFVQLHQASPFYGVASTVLGTGATQTSGPETGLQERARVSEIRAYYDRLLHQRFLESGRVTFLGGSEYTRTARRIS